MTGENVTLQNYFDKKFWNGPYGGWDLDGKGLVGKWEMGLSRLVPHMSCPNKIYSRNFYQKYSA